MPYVKILKDSRLIQDYCVQLDIRGSDVAALRQNNDDLVSLTFTPLSYINVRDYGAIGNGVHDDYAACQAALNAAATLLNGAIVYFPAGIYYLSNGLSVASYTHVIGAGIGLTVLLLPPTIPGFTTNGHGTTAAMAIVAKTHALIEGITVDLATNQTFANGITMECDGPTDDGTRTTYCTIRHCEVLGAPFHEYLIWNLKGQHNQILHNVVDGGPGSSGTGQAGIELLGSFDVLVAGNRVRRSGSPLTAFAALGVLNASNENIKFLHNHVEDCDQGVTLAAVFHVATGPMNLLNVEVAHNTILNCAAKGIEVDALMAQTSLENIDIHDNIIVGCTVGVDIDGVDRTSNHRGIKVHDNMVKGATSVTGAMQFTRLAALALDGNHVEDSDGPSLYLVQADHAKIRGNDLDKCPAIMAMIAQCDDLEIAGNEFRDFNETNVGPSAIVLDGCNRARVHDNGFGAAFEPAGCLNAYANCDAVAAWANHKLTGAWQTNTVLQGTNNNFGELTIGVGLTFVDVPNSQAKVDARYSVQQVSGTFRQHQVVWNPNAGGPGVGGFRITIDAAAAGDEVFRWEIIV